MNLLANILVFQAGWFATVLGAANGLPWIGPAAALAAVALHLRFAARPGVELRLVLTALGLGLVADSLLLATGWIAYPNGQWLPGAAPYWIGSLWVLFACTLNVSMRWLRGRYVLAAAFGAVGGPLSYLAGSRLGAMTFAEPVPALTALAIGWAVMMPVLVWLASRLDGYRQLSRPGYILEEWRRADTHG